MDFQLSIIDRYLSTGKKKSKLRKNFIYEGEEIKEKKKNKSKFNIDIPFSDILDEVFKENRKSKRESEDIKEKNPNKKKKKKGKKKNKGDARIVDHEGFDSSEYSIKEMDEDRHNFQEYLRVIDRYAILKSITPEEYKKAKKTIEGMIDDLKHYRYWKVYNDERHSKYIREMSGNYPD